VVEEVDLDPSPHEAKMRTKIIDNAAKVDLMFIFKRFFKISNPKIK